MCGSWPLGFCGSCRKGNTDRHGPCEHWLRNDRAFIDHKECHSETSPQAGRGNPFPLCRFSFSFRRVLFFCRERPPAAHFSQQLEKWAKAHTVVSAGFQPFARRENRDASSKPPCCIRHRRCFGGFAYFLSLLTKSMPPETKKATGKSHPPEKKTSLHSDLLPKNPI